MYTFKSLRSVIKSVLLLVSGDNHKYSFQTMNDRCQLRSRYEGSQIILDMTTSQAADDPERCDSVELDDKIRILIEKNGALESCKNKKLESNSCVVNESMDSEKIPGGVSEPKMTKKNISTDILEQQIIALEKQRQELLAVNNQWDQQFRRMKQYYEKKVTEMKAKLEIMQKSLRELEKERHQIQQECQKLKALTIDKRLQEMRGKETLKEENRLLKEETILANTQKMHYECEINRLNKALLDALQMPQVDSLDRNCSQEEIKMQMAVLRQQVQIYEEDFKKERSDRERLNEEKEALLQINEISQTQLDKLNSQIKDFQEEKELLEKQVQQQARDLRTMEEKHVFPRQVFIPPCLSCRNCGLHQPYNDITLTPHGINRGHQPSPDYQWYDRFPPDVRHKANDASSKKEVPHM